MCSCLYGILLCRHDVGAEAGDGRDESNRSLQERLEDARMQQTAADAALAEAELSVKHLSKQLAEHRKSAASKEKEGAALNKELDRNQAKVAECTSRLQVRGGIGEGGMGVACGGVARADTVKHRGRTG